MNDSRSRALRIALGAAPAPQFILTLVTLATPELGARDAAITALIAFGASYGVMLGVGLPLHLLLRHVRKHALSHYIMVSVLAVLALIGFLTLLEVAIGGPSTPLPGDNSPFAGATLANGLAILFGLISIPFAALSATIFWALAVKPFRPAAEYI